MKKILILGIILSSLLYSCGKKEEYRDTVYPSEILPAEDISPYFSYALKAKDEIRGRRVSSQVYLSDPLGNDPVIIELSQFNALQTGDEVRQKFEKEKTTRTDIIPLEIGDADAFIAYPSIHYYTSGYYVKITAGSGSDESQQTLLTNLAKLSLENLISITGLDKKEAEDMTSADDEGSDAVIEENGSTENEQASDSEPSAEEQAADESVSEE